MKSFDIRLYRKGIKYIVIKEIKFELFYSFKKKFHGTIKLQIFWGNLFFHTFIFYKKSRDVHIIFDSFKNCYVYFLATVNQSRLSTKALFFFKCLIKMQSKCKSMHCS